MNDPVLEHLLDTDFAGMSGTNYTCALLRNIDISGIPKASDLHSLSYIDNICKEKMLVEATFGGKTSMVNRILEVGVSVDAEEYNRYLFCHSKLYMTPLQIAAARGWGKCLKALIIHGADLNARDRFDVTATHMAAEQGHYACLKSLLDGGADCNASTKYYRRGYGYKATAPYYKGTTPLHLAAANNHIDCVKELIYFGADYNAVDERGRTGLYLAAQLGFEECVMAQLTNAVGREILSLPGHDSGDTPLHFAVRRGMIEAVKTLLQHGADINHLNFSGHSPLHLVVGSAYNPAYSLEILKLLIKYGHDANINQTDSVGLLPLHYVSFDTMQVMSRRPEMARFLIALGSNVHIANHQGRSLIQNEYNSPDPDTTLLKAIMDSMCMPPPPMKLKDINVPGHGNRYPRHHHHHHPHHPHRRHVMHPHHPLHPHHPRHFYYRNRLGYPDLRLEDEAEMDIDFEFDDMHFDFEFDDMPPQPPQQPQVQPNVQEVTFTPKQVWYNEEVSKPPELQHLCRYVIRQAMGPKRLRDIKNLMIPVFLETYILLGEKI